jgi:hypothetical protein
VLPKKVGGRLCFNSLKSINGLGLTTKLGGHLYLENSIS